MVGEANSAATTSATGKSDLMSAGYRTTPAYAYLRPRIARTTRSDVIG
jgi:hypothetical protein